MDDNEELVKYSRELEEDLDVNRSGDLPKKLVCGFGGLDRLIACCLFLSVLLALVFGYPGIWIYIFLFIY